MKYLFTFEKAEPARWLGHLDILRAFERAIRRADLPVALSSGYNPRERIAFASALGVGATAEQEPALLELREALPADEMVGRLNAALPPGLRVLEASAVPDAGARDRMGRFGAAEWRVTCDVPGGTTAAVVDAAARALLSRPELLVDRVKDGRPRRVDVRPFICSVDAGTAGDGQMTLTIVVTIGARGSARPGEIVSLLATEVPGLVVRRVHRVRLLETADSE